MPKITAFEATALIEALSGGVVPSVGIQHVTVGRKKEVTVIARTLKDVAAGHSLMRFWIGNFGSGKSFMLELIKQIAWRQQFAVAQADFTPQRRLYDNSWRATDLYSELVRNLSTKTQMQGGALESILDEWLDRELNQMADEASISRAELLKTGNLEQIRQRIIASCEKSVYAGGHEFGTVVAHYFTSFIEGDDKLKRATLKWFEGGYRTKTELNRDLGIRLLINDKNYYDMLKNLSAFLRQLGYAGLVINLDEGVNLCKIAQSPIRTKNYEQLLYMYNDCLKQAVAGLLFNVGGTYEFLANEQRGLFSYEALKTRLSGNVFEMDEIIDYNQPVIYLHPLTDDEIFYLLGHLEKVFAVRHQTEISLSKAERKQFMQHLLNREGAAELLTPREVIRSFLNILNLIEQHPKQRAKILAKIETPSPDQTAIDESKIEIV